MKHIYLFSDGSCLGNPGAGGYATILKYQNKKKFISGGDGYTTNNKMELKGVIEGLKALKQPCKVDIISDSVYVVKGINEWLKNWIKKDFKNVKNSDLWREYILVSAPHDIKASWVKGHSGHKENEQCDEIARNEAQKFKGDLS